MQLFYSRNIEQDYLTLDPDEASHCTKVLRKGIGDLIEVVDGMGNLYKCAITEISRKSCLAKIIERQPEFGKRNYAITIGMAPTKNMARFEWFLEKATEIGIDEINPLITERSERRQLKMERLNKLLVSAMKQSGKAYLPKLNPLVSFSEFVNMEVATKQQFIATCELDHLNHLKSQYKKGSDVVVLIGPEGDFSEEEIQLAVNKSYYPISLGKSRLRVETAGVVACHTISLMNEN